MIAQLHRDAHTRNSQAIAQFYLCRGRRSIFFLLWLQKTEKERRNEAGAMRMHMNRRLPDWQSNKTRFLRLHNFTEVMLQLWRQNSTFFFLANKNDGRHTSAIICFISILQKISSAHENGTVGNFAQQATANKIEWIYICSLISMTQRKKKSIISQLVVSLPGPAFFSIKIRQLNACKQKPNISKY